MKKRIFCLTLAVLLSMALALTTNADTSAATDDTFVIDAASLLTDGEKIELSDQLRNISYEYGVQIAVATIDTFDGDSLNDSIGLTYDELELGYGSNRDGILLLVSVNPQQYSILTEGLASKAIDKNDIESIGSAIVSDLSAGNYLEAFQSYADECAYYLDGHMNGFPFKFGQNLLISLVIGIVAGIIVAFVLKGQLKSVRKQDRANVYVKPGSMQLTTSIDLFLYRTIDRRKKESSSSGSSGSTRNVGGGSF